MIKSIIEYFIDLVKIDSETQHENAVAQKLAKDLRELGAQVKFDNANAKAGGDIGNLYGYFPGNIKKEPILFCAHMDTVQPGIGIKPQIRDGKIFSDGTTILGSDDKSGIAEIICGIKGLLDSGEKHAPIEVLFTIAEETGLLGAKHLDYAMIKSRIGYALDSHVVGSIAVGAPAQNSLKFTVIGKESHAGVAPEKGINAIKIAAEAISIMPMGRIDAETTCNVGIIQGGKATNIIPNEVMVKAEARSHNQASLKKITEQMTDAFINTAKKYKLGDYQAKVDIKISQEYQAFLLSDEDDVVQIAEKAAENLGIKFTKIVGGGGSDVNIFNQHGLTMAVAGTGMENVHSVDEFIEISELETGALWVKEIIRLHSQK
ncbi:MAG: M20/M25/M40 family metallo-hydrolase [Candidatus Cloacimonadales bacterium]|nr:M20/M25/M40 family metallo-hydrolase [Candidatus Cloacimonadales bacterium]